MGPFREICLCGRTYTRPETHGFQQIRRIYRFFRKDSFFRKQRQMGGNQTTGTVFQIAPREFFWRSERDGNVHYYRYSTEGTLLGKATDGGVQTMSVIGLAGDIFYYTATADAGMDRTVKFTDLKTGKVGFVRSDKGTWNGFLDPAGKYMVCTFTDLNTLDGRTRRPYKGRAQYGQDRTATFRG